MHLMTRKYERGLMEFVRLMDVLTIFVAFYMAYAVRNAPWFPTLINEWFGSYLPLPLQMDFRVEHFEQLLWIIVPMWLFLFSYSHAYDFNRTGTFLAVVKSVFKVHLIGGIVMGTVLFITNWFHYRRTFVILFIAFSFMLTLLVRFFVHFGLRYVRTRGRNRNRAMVLGNGQRAMKALVELGKHQYWGFNIEGIISELPLKENTLLGMRVLGTMDDLENILRRTPVDDIFVAMDEGKYVELKQILKVCENIGVTVHLLPDKFDLEIAKSSVGTLGEMEFVTFFTIQDNPAQRAAKRALDIAVSLTLLPSLIVSYVIIGILIKLDSEGPVIYKCMRLTRNRRPFVFYKFRTMLKGAEEEFELVSHRNTMHGPIAKIKDDPRVTRVGRYLRKYSLDELPQIINVLLGDMSLVGPRPPLPEEVDLYTLPQLRKLSMQQGITGLWQVNGRDDVVRFEDRLKMDLEYIDHWSLWLDMKILCKTLFVVLRGAM
ncbi:MAG: sugar transferase [Nitrospinae bacterium]|nr:sugar transferase [Nitrospinota bacterium]